MIEFATVSHPVSRARSSMQSPSGKSMGKSHSVLGKFSQAREHSAQRTAKFLRRLYPTKTADRVAADTGIPATAVAKWLTGNSAPSMGAVIALVDAYGTDFLAAVMPVAPSWLVKANREARQADLQAQQARIAAELAELSQ